jgi:hypothetical protein
MNKINPLYALAFVVLLLVFLIISSERMQSASKRVNSDILNTQSVAKELTLLKSRWSDKKAIKERINSILLNPTVASQISKKEASAKRYTVEFKTLDKRGFDWLMNKVLNSFLRIDKIKVDRVSKKSVYLRIEFKL